MKKIEPNAKRNLIAFASAYAAIAGVKLSTVSRFAHGEPSFFDVLIQNKPRREGGALPSCTLRKYDEVMAWFETNWPDGVKKPRLRKFP